jgi:two-component system, chemotaxis family, chemotaxis protein CheY
MSQPSKLADYSVLVAEDSEDARRILRFILKEAGLSEICEVENGLEAKQALSRHYFDLVIADWMMPKLSGLELLTWIRENQKLKKVPVIMVTANNTHDAVIEAVELGATDFIAKPYSLHTMISKINKALGNPLKAKGQS